MDLSDLRERDGDTSAPKIAKRKDQLPSVINKTQKKVYKTVNDAVSAMLRGVAKSHQNAVLSHSWMYRSADGSDAMVEVRFDYRIDHEIKKTFMQASKRDKGWVLSVPPSRPLYRLPELVSQTGPVLIVEGPKCAELAVRRLTSASESSEATRQCLIAVSAWSGGANSVAKTDWSPIANREVWIWPDVGAESTVEAVATEIRKHNPEAIIKVVTNHGLEGEGDDIEQWLDMQGVEEHAESLLMKIKNMTQEAPSPKSTGAPASLETIQVSSEAKSAAKAGKEEVDEFDTSIIKAMMPHPLPLDVMPLLFRGYVTHQASAINIDPKSLGLTLFAAVLGAVGSTVSIRLTPEYTQPAVMWSLVVDRSGSRKTSTLKAGTRFLQEQQEADSAAYAASINAHKEALAAWKRDKEGDQPVPPPQFAQRIIHDFTIEALLPLLRDNDCRGLTVVADEFSGTLGSFGRYTANGKSSPEEATFNMVWNGQSVSRNRMSSSDPSNKYISVRYSNTSIVGFIQPRILMNSTTSQMFDSGFMARFILSMPQEMQTKRIDRSSPAKSDLNECMKAAFSVLTSCNHDNGKSVEIELAKGAIVAFDDFDEWVQEQRDVKESLGVALFVRKAAAHAGRFALALHLMKYACGEAHKGSMVSEETMHDAIRLARWAIDEQRRVYRLFSFGESKLHGILAFVLSRDGSVSVSEYREARRVSAEEADADLALLLQHKIANCKCPAPGPAGGRPQSPVYTLKPEILKLFQG